MAEGSSSHVGGRSGAVVPDVSLAHLTGLFNEDIGDEGRLRAASVNLGIGRMFDPADFDANGSSGDDPGPLSHDEFVVRPGKAVVVETAEYLTMPDDLAGFAFPRPSLSGAGLLLTNPGQVDPGYRGHLTFTLINMGDEDRILVSGRRNLASLTLLRVESPGVGQNWLARLGLDDSDPSFRDVLANRATQETKRHLRSLGTDFLGVEKSARAAASDQLAKDTFKTSIIIAGLFLVITVLSVYLMFAAGSGSLNDLQRRVECLQFRLDHGSPTGAGTEVCTGVGTEQGR
jgi:dCTP deaminase